MNHSDQPNAETAGRTYELGNLPERMSRTINGLDNERRRWLENQFADIISSMSTRTRNAFSRRTLTIAEVVKIISTSDMDLGSYPGCGRRTLSEVREKFSCLPDLMAQADIVDPVAILRDRLLRNFPTLNAADAERAMAFESTHGHLPVFFITYRFLQRCNDDPHVAKYAAHWGLNGTPVSRADLAAKYGMTPERIRQIVVSYRLPAPISRLHPEQLPLYGFLNNPFINEHRVFAMLNETEFAPADHFTDMAMGSIARLFTSVKMFRFGGHGFLVTPDLAKQFAVREAVGALERLIGLRTIANYTTSLTETFVRPFMRAERLDDDMLRAASQLMADIATDVFNLKVNLLLDTVEIPQNTVDIDHEVCIMLREAARPMTLQELYKRLKEKFPNHKYDNPEPMRAHINTCPQIKAIGKSSTYALAEWDNVPTLSIREWIHKFVSESPTPLSPQEMVDMLAEKGYFTSVNSVSGSIAADTTFPYVRFPRGRYGKEGVDYGPDCQPLGPDNLPQRRTFDQWISLLTQFMSTHGHLPFSSAKGNHEDALQRWYYNVLTGRLTLTPAQTKRFNSEMARLDDCRLNAFEYAFKQKCDMCRQLLSEGRSISTMLRIWLRQARTKHFADRRATFLAQLEKDILNYSQND